MAILTRPRLLPQERYDLEDLNAMLSAARADSLLYTKEFVGSLNYILKGFAVSGLGLQTATIAMTDATLIVPQSTSDFSWFVAPTSGPDITIPPSSFIDGVRNYVEIELKTVNNTLVTRAFWDPEANSGNGAEFNQSIETMTDLDVQVVVLTGGFSGLPDRLPVAILDIDGSGNIKTILDRRNMYFRLAKPNDLNHSYAWGSKTEPVYSLNMTSVLGVFVAGETITMNTETATVVTGGTNNITFNFPSGINFFPGSSVTGGTSGASGTVNMISESFSGVDKSISTQKDENDALETEIKNIKGTAAWWMDAGSSIIGLQVPGNSVFVQAILNSTFVWSGSNLSIKDTSVGSPSAADILAYIRIMGRAGNLGMARMDGTGGTSTIPIGEKQVLFVSIPATGSRTFAGNGSGSTNYQVVNIASFIPSDANYWIAYRELNRLYVRGYGELNIGESIDIGDPELEDVRNLMNSKLIEGGTWSLDSTGANLTSSAISYVQVPGLTNDRNSIAAQTINLPNSNSVAWVSLNRLGGGTSTVTVNVSDANTLTLADADFIIARKTSMGVLVGRNSFLLKPGEYLEIDGALAEINRLLGQLRLKQSISALNKVTISGSDTSLLDQATLSQIIGQSILEFDGAVINFTTGVINHADDSTPLGTNFTPFSVGVGNYFWYGISLIPGNTDTDNRQFATVQVEPATSDNATANLAPKPNLTGDIKLGMIQVHNVAGSIVVSNIVRLGVGSGSGTGSSDDSAAQEPMPGYDWLEFDKFANNPSSLASKVVTTSYTNASYNAAKKMFSLACDKSKTVSSNTGTAFAPSSAPTFTVAVGDIVYVTSGARSGQWRRISVVTSQISYTLDSAFTGGNASGGDTIMISQAVWTKDLVNFGSVSDETRARDQHSGNIVQIGLDYFDSLLSGDNVPDYVEPARIMASASNSGLVSDVGVPTSDQFGFTFERQPYPAQINNFILQTNTNQQRLFLAFFCDPTNVSVTASANLIKYEVSFFQDSSQENGGVLDSAFVFSDSSATPINCSQPTVVVGKTRVALDWSYVPTVNPGTTTGTLRVFVDGLEIPRFVAGSTNDAYYKEIQDTNGAYSIVEFYTDLSGVPLSIEIIRSEGVVDTASSNTTRIAKLERPTSYTMTYNGAQVTAVATATNYVVAVPSFTMNVPAGRYRFSIRMMGSISIAVGNEAAIFIALTKNSASPGGANLISKEYAMDGALFIGGSQVTPSNPGWNIYTEEITLNSTTPIFIASMYFPTSGVPTLQLGIRGDLSNQGGSSVIEAIRIGDV